MPTLFDPAKLLSVMLADDELAPKLTPVIRQAAIKAFEVALKTKTFEVRDLKTMRRALGSDEFELVVDALKDAPLRNAVKRLDPNHPRVVGSTGAIDAAWARQHLGALAAGKASPRAESKPLDKRLAAKDRSRAKLKALADEIGPHELMASLVAMKDPAARAFVKKLDPKHPAAKGKATSIDVAWARRHIAKVAGISLPEAEQVDETGAEWFARLQRMYATEAR